MIPRKYSLLGRNIIWAGVIFFLCAIPSDSIPDPKLNIPHQNWIRIGVPITSRDLRK